MGDLSKNFSRVEFGCKCGCGFNTVDAELINSILQPAREYFEKPIRITPNGGCRCEEHNRNCGGVKQSQHIKGKAADIYIEGITTTELYKYFHEKFPNRYGIGIYISSGFVHVDCRDSYARWQG